MREFTIRLCFTQPCLGNVKQKSGRFLMPRTPDGSSVIFLSTWWQANMRVASQLLGKHQSTVGKIFWDVQVDGQPRKNRFYRRYSSSGKYAEHEAFFPGDSIGINCAVPATISPDDLLSLMEIAGRYCGISPYKPRKYGFFEIVSVRQRRIHTPESDFGRSVKDEDRIADDKESHFAKSGRDEKVREPPDNRSDHG